MIGLKWTEIGILSNFINQNFISLVNEAHFKIFIIKQNLPKKQNIVSYGDKDIEKMIDIYFGIINIFQMGFIYHRNKVLNYKIW